ncbi:MAG: hypothetical protein ACOCP4_06195 [Candidatus Woesearchaeota archaeon]
MVQKKDKKGIVFTIDSIFALLIVSGMISFLFFNFTNINDEQHKYIPISISNDILESLELSGRFNDAIDENNSTIIETYLNNSLPPHFCSILNVYNSSEINFSVSSGNCDTSKDKDIAYRNFVFDNVEFYARMEVWID